jgi:hypothetical protein
VGAKDWMLLYAEGAIRPVLQAAPAVDRAAARALVGRLYPKHRIAQVEDGTLFEQANPPECRIYAGCFPGLTVVCTGDAALDRPSQLRRRFLDEAAGRTVYLYAMHSVADWFAYAIWAGDGTLRRALSLSPGSGIIENTGTPWTSRVPSGPDSARSGPLVSAGGRTRCRFTPWNSAKRHCALFSASTTRASTTTTILILRTLCSPASPCTTCLTDAREPAARSAQRADSARVRTGRSVRAAYPIRTALGGTESAIGTPRLGQCWQLRIMPKGFVAERDLNPRTCAP